MIDHLATEPGVFGKLPARGDFIQRNLSQAFVQSWDAWLQEALQKSRDQLGEHWLRNYLTSPVWRFALSAGNCGPQSIAGVLMPSVDRVGRYFPLTIAIPLPSQTDLLALLGGQNDWFDQAEQVVLAGLDDNLDLEQFIEQVSALSSPAYKTVLTTTNNDHSTRWYCELGSLHNLHELPEQLTSPLLQQLFPSYSLWWTHGSEHIASCLLACTHLPAVDGFAAMLAGEWSDRGWGVVPLNVHD